VLKYFAQYFATGKAQAGSVSTSVQYTMQYQ
jgi:major type 1 subunit fimbrin (pilin)